MEDLSVGDLVECIAEGVYKGKRGLILECTGYVLFKSFETNITCLKSAYCYKTDFLDKVEEVNEILPRYTLRKIVDDGKELSNWSTGVWAPKDSTIKAPSTIKTKVRKLKHEA